MKAMKRYDTAADIDSDEIKRRSSTSINFLYLIYNPKLMLFFLDFLSNFHENPHMSSGALLFWLEIEEFKQLIGKRQRLVEQADIIFQKYFEDQSRYPGAVLQKPDGIKELRRVRQLLDQQHPTLNMFTKIQSLILDELNSNFYNLFLQSKSYVALGEELKMQYRLNLSQVLSNHNYVRYFEAYLLVEKSSDLGNLLFYLDLHNSFLPQAKRMLKTTFIDSIDNQVETASPPNNDGTQLMKTLTAQRQSSNGSYITNLLPVVAASSSTSLNLKLKRHELVELVASAYELLDRFLSRSSKLEAKQVTDASRTYVADALKRYSNGLGLGDGSDIDATSPDGAEVAKWRTASKIGPLSSVGVTSTVLDDLLNHITTVFNDAQQDILTWMNDEAFPQFTKSDFYLALVVEIEQNSGKAKLDMNCIKPVMHKGQKTSSMLLLQTTTSDGPQVVHDHKSASPLTLDADPSATPSALAAEQATGLLYYVRVDAALKDYRDSFEHLFAAPIPTQILRQRFRDRVEFHSVVSESHLVGQTVRVGSVELEEATDNEEDEDDGLEVDQPDELHLHMLRDIHRFCLPHGIRLLDCSVVQVAGDERRWLHSFVMPARKNKGAYRFFYGACLTVYRKATLAGDTADAVPAGEHQKSGLITFSVTKTPEFAGLGMNLILYDNAIVISKFMDSPDGSPGLAQQSGLLQVGDQLELVNELSVVNRTFQDVINQIVQAHELHLVFKRSLTAKQPLHYLAPTCYCLLSSLPCLDSLRLCLAEMRPEELGAGEETKAQVTEQFERRILGSFDRSILQPGLGFDRVMQLLSLSNVVDLLGYLMLGKRVVLCSDHINLLTDVGEALLLLLHPFVYRYTYYPLLPLVGIDGMVKKLTGVDSFLVGIHTVDLCPPGTELTGRVFHCKADNTTLRSYVQQEVDSQSSAERLIESQLLEAVMDEHTVVVDLDADLILANASHATSQFPYEMRYSLIAQAATVLRQRKHLLLDDALLQPVTKCSLFDQIQPLVVQLYSELLRDYRLFFIAFENQHIRNTTTIAFNTEVFLSCCPAAHRSFLRQFLQTETFAEFLVRSYKNSA